MISGLFLGLDTLGPILRSPESVKAIQFWNFPTAAGEIIQWTVSKARLEPRTPHFNRAVELNKPRLDLRQINFGVTP